MAIDYHNLESTKKSRKQRRGRGLGSGRGAKSQRGQKGQKSRSGVSGLARIGMRKLILATPKLRGFKSPNAAVPVVNLDDIARAFEKGAEITPSVLKQKALIRTARHGAKILGSGELDFAVKVKGCNVSKTAAEAITKAGGSINA